MSAQPNSSLENLCQIASEAGRRILPFFQSSFSHRLKADNSPVTEADLASHAFLVDALSELSPQRIVISEESAGTEAMAQSPLEEYWLIDPLDGTKEFMKGKSEFTVNIALMREGRPMVGIVHAPALGITYFAETGKGSWRQAGQNPAMQIRTRQAQRHQLTVVASKDHSGPPVKRMLAKLNSPALTTIGSSLKFCLVAEGQADLYFRDLPTMEWDTAAAQCVVETAGGQVLDLTGGRLNYGKPALRNTGFVVVGDPNFPWHEWAPAADNHYAFRSFFAEVCQETGKS